eukprot:TRINITY_DN6309_c0_g1_i1.p1 TRINITY_DN6309_c0_g1~~TRINITY_DN6309_c0_g1_i1.p1  ORF type:complete len:346 (+),score=110.98 TRINITY_DN6309_c0_g1_i1:88-1125(+)
MPCRGPRLAPPAPPPPHRGDAAPLNRVLSHPQGSMLCITALRRYLSDALDPPEESRVRRRIDIARPQFRSRVASVPGAVDFLVQECGFRLEDGVLVPPPLDTEAARLQLQWTLDHLQQCTQDCAADARLRLQLCRVHLRGMLREGEQGLYCAVQCITLGGVPQLFEFPVAPAQAGDLHPLEGSRPQQTQCEHGMELTVEVRKRHRLRRDEVIASGRATFLSPQGACMAAASATVHLGTGRGGTPCGTARFTLDSDRLKAYRPAAPLESCSESSEGEGEGEGDSADSPTERSSGSPAPQEAPGDCQCPAAAAVPAPRTSRPFVVPPPPQQQRRAQRSPPVVEVRHP